jgi:hypothetical protein
MRGGVATSIDVVEWAATTTISLVSEARRRRTMADVCPCYICSTPTHSFKSIGADVSVCKECDVQVRLVAGVEPGSLSKGYG